MSTEERIQQCVSFMRQHLDQPLQVATLAARASVSPSHFFVLFKRFAGSSPIDYFIRLRVQRACELLETGLLPVKDVAAAVGYEDPFYFSRVFKSVTGLAPREYRCLMAELEYAKPKEDLTVVWPNSRSTQFHRHETKTQPVR